MLKSQQMIYYVISICLIMILTLTFMYQPDNRKARTANANMLGGAPNNGREPSQGENFSAVQFLQKLNYKTDGFLEIKEVVIPAVFDDTYKKYNEIQKKAGLDLTKYRGRRVMLHTYSITNYAGDMPGMSEHSQAYARANLLFFDGAIVGGDIEMADGTIGPLVQKSE